MPETRTMRYAAPLAVAASTVLALGATGCANSFEGSGSKDAASAEQLAMHTDDPWDFTIEKKADRAQGSLVDGVYTGVGKGVDGPVSVTILVDDNRITVLETAQEGETQSVGGYEAIRDGKFAQMIEAAQGSEIDTISGATFTTAAIIEATDDALAQAAAGEADPEKQSAHVAAGQEDGPARNADDMEEEAN